MEMDQKRFRVLVIVVFVIVGMALGYVLYISPEQNEQTQGEKKAIEISKQTPEVQSYLSIHPNAKSGATRLYIESNGSVYTANDHWELIRYEGKNTQTPVDGKDHYCWVVGWYDPTISWTHLVNVYIDKDSWEIILVEPIFSF